MGDNAEVAMIELVDFNEYFQGFGGEKASAKKTTRRGRSKSSKANAEGETTAETAE
jgi:large subunit ribosomal protein L17